MSTVRRGEIEKRLRNSVLLCDGWITLLRLLQINLIVATDAAINLAGQWSEKDCDKRHLYSPDTIRRRFKTNGELLKIIEETRRL